MRNVVGLFKYQINIDCSFSLQKLRRKKKQIKTALLRTDMQYVNIMTVVQS